MTTAKQISVNIGTDELEKHTKCKPIAGIAELVWNSLDANATEIKIQVKENATLGIESIVVTDNGEGFSYQAAEHAFGFVGNSKKRNREKTTGDKRALHGCEGKGRLKALSVGKDVEFHSVYLDEVDGVKKEFDVNIGLSNLKISNISALKQHKDQSKPTETKVKITNIEGQTTLFSEANLDFLEEHFAIYYSLYKDFTVAIDGANLDFESKIKSTYPQSGFQEMRLKLKNGGEIDLSLKIIEWNFSPKKNTKREKQLKNLNLCSLDGCPLYQDTLGLETDGRKLSLYVMSDFIKLKQKDGCLLPVDDDTSRIIAEARLFLKNFLELCETEKRKHFVEQLKKDRIYPYQTEPKTDIEIAERDLFDIIAIKIDEGLPRFSSSDNTNKKLTLALVKEAIISKSDKLNNILQEVCNLDDGEIEKLNELLTQTTLPNIIATTNQIVERLKFLSELKELVAGDISKKVLERSQLHKIIERELWLFGEEYKDGLSNKTLENVLKAHIKKNLGRDELVGKTSKKLGLIPDLCLWGTVPLDYDGRAEHLFVELKRPSVKATMTEMTQINDYARAVVEDNRFTKENTNWKFMLIVSDIDDQVSTFHQEKGVGGGLNGCYGGGDNYKIYIYQWSYLIERYQGRLRKLQEMLDLKIKESPEDFNYLKKVHAEFLPTEAR